VLQNLILLLIILQANRSEVEAIAKEQTYAAWEIL
jgi:hypothetical protein